MPRSNRADLRKIVLLGRVALLAILVAAAAPGAPSAMAAGSTRDNIARILESFGFPVELETSEDGAQLIKTTLNGIDTLLQLGACSANGTICKDLAFISAFPQPEPPGIEAVLRANAGWPFVRIFSDAESGGFGAEMDIALASGDLDTRVSVGIDLWTDIAGALNNGLDFEGERYEIREKTRASVMSSALIETGALIAQPPERTGRTLINLVSPDWLSEQLKSRGLEAFSASDAWFREISTTIDGIETALSPAICNVKMKHCGAVALTHVKELPEGFDPAILDRWNASEWYVRVFPNDDESVTFEMDIVSFAGMSEVDFDHYLDAWRGEIAYFEQFAAEIGDTSESRQRPVEPDVVATCFEENTDAAIPEKECGEISNRAVLACVNDNEETGSDQGGAYRCIGNVSRSCAESAFVTAVDNSTEAGAQKRYERQLSCIAAEYNGWMNLIGEDLDALDPHFDRIGNEYLAAITDSWKNYWTAMCDLVGTVLDEGLEKNIAQISCRTEISARHALDIHAVRILNDARN